MAKYSKQANDLIKRANYAHDVHSTNGEEIAGLAQPLFDAALPGEESVNVALFLKASDGIMRQRKAELEAADQLVMREVGEDEAALNARDEVFVSARQSTLRIRQQLNGTYGDGFASLLGLNANLPDDPMQLHRLLKGAAQLLNAPEKPLSMPTPLDPHSPAWTRDALVQRLTTVCAPLENAVAEATRELKETQDAKRKRRDALEALHRSIITSNAHLEHLARLVGKHDIADRIRPRGGRPATASQETPTTGETPSAPETPADPGNA